MKNVFDGLSTLNTDEEIISELENMSTETSKSEKQTKKAQAGKQNKTISKNYGTVTKSVTYAQ